MWKKEEEKNKTEQQQIIYTTYPSTPKLKKYTMEVD